MRLGNDRWKRLGIPIVTAVLLTAIGLVVMLRHRAPSPPPIPAAVTVPVKHVVWQLTTNPPGAEIVRISDGEVLGLTPWKSEQAASNGKFGVTLRRAGYLDTQVLLNRETDCEQTVQLESVPTDQAGAEKPGQGRKKSGKSAKPSQHHETSHDDGFAPVR
jgi:hypothetical protein